MPKIISGIESINADTLDGKHADEFVLKNGNTMLRNVTYSTNNPSVGENGDMWIKYNTSNSTKEIFVNMGGIWR